jgi:chromosome segregation ATPase
MFKKLVYAALAGVGVLVLLSSLGLLGYVKVALKGARERAKASVPAEMKIQLLRQEIANLGPEMSKHRAAIAAEIVEVERLKKHIGEAKGNLAKKEVLIRDLRNELKAGSAFVSISGEKLPREKVEQSLTRQWEAFKQAEDAVKSQEDLLRTREESLEVAKQKLSAMDSKREELQAKVERMELELRKLRLAQTQNGITVDDSQFANVLKLAEEVEIQIAKEQKTLELEKAAFTDTVVQKAIEQKSKTDQAIKEMDERFGSARKPA